MKTETGKLSAPEWIAELTERELTLSQKAALTDWLRESPIHVRDFLQLTLLHQDLAALPIQLPGFFLSARGMLALFFSPFHIFLRASSCFLPTSLCCFGLDAIMHPLCLRFPEADSMPHKLSTVCLSQVISL